MLNRVKLKNNSKVSENSKKNVVQVNTSEKITRPVVTN